MFVGPLAVGTVKDMPGVRERRVVERRRGEALDDRQMRCSDCGTVWYSGVAGTVTRWGRCALCGGSLHVERRAGDRRDVAAAVSAA